MAKLKKSASRSRKTKVIPSRHVINTPAFCKATWLLAGVLSLILIASCGLMAINTESPKAPKSSVLAYATEMSYEGLLKAHNQERTSRGLGTLSLNSTLNSAAQTKAEDIVARDYWSHDTPEGKEPWVFAENAGFEYAKYRVGENLAVGYLTSEQTVAAWMTSPTHKANILLKEYNEVGFGTANAPNFTGKGNVTVVVALFAIPIGAPPPEAPIEETVVLPPPQTNPTPTPQNPSANIEDLISADSQSASLGLGSSYSPSVNKAEKDADMKYRMAMLKLGAGPLIRLLLVISAVSLLIFFIARQVRLVKRIVKHEKIMIRSFLADIVMAALLAGVIYLWFFI